MIAPTGARIARQKPVDGIKPGAQCRGANEALSFEIGLVLGFVFVLVERAAIGAHPQQSLV